MKLLSVQCSQLMDKAVTRPCKVELKGDVRIWSAHAAKSHALCVESPLAGLFAR